MQLHASATARVGVAIVGLGGAVSTTAVAGIELLRGGHVDSRGLPLAALDAELAGGLVSYERLVFGGWDMYGESLARAAEHHNVLTPAQLAAVSEELERIVPWPAVANADFCRNLDGRHVLAVESHRAAVEAIRNDLRRFQEREGLDGVVMINLASTERLANVALPIFHTPEAFEEALDRSDPAIGPAMLYAYAAIEHGVPYVNFTPSVAVDTPALTALAELRGVPVVGKDGKTGQTMIKTVLASALRSRALHVDGWFSTNILGNRDGQVLADEASLQSKVVTKSSVIDQILGYKVEDHIVQIHYYRPRGDNKEAWDNIDISGFLGQPMQLKVNFLCRDSILAAPLVIELARLMDLARRTGARGPQEQLGYFFKLPMTADPAALPEHALHTQEERLMSWLSTAREVGQARAVGDPEPR